MKKVAFYTLGCKVNQYETEAMTELFEDAGFQVVEFDETADAYVINTCTVTGLSARKSRQIIRRGRQLNSNAIIAVVGCYPQTAPEEVEKIPEADVIIGTNERARIVEYVNEAMSSGIRINVVGNIMRTKAFEDLKIDRYKGRTRAFLKIQEGCNQFCSYCIIPYARGPIRSRLGEDILREVEKLAANGFREVVLTGIHIASYGKDLGDTSLLELIKSIHKIEGISRIRIGSVEPATITDEFIDTAARLEKLCPHYHISLQSGCDATLKRMNRKYTAEEYFNKVAALRNRIKDVAITTDVMVGFPGESAQEFDQTFSFLEDISFAQMHVFKYSPRKGTPAASFSEQVDSGEKESRSARVQQLAAMNTLKFNEGYLGKVMPVLIEQDVKAMEGCVEGLTSNYIRVICEGNASLKGSIASVRLLKAEADYIIGEINEM